MKYSFLLLTTVFSCALYLSGFSAANKNTITGNILTGVLSGKVTEASSGRPIAGATVYINDLKLGVVTDTSGNYSFRNLPSGTFLVEARSVGFKALTHSVMINGAVVENFQLTENVVEESEVVVTGLSKATQIRRSPIPIVSVSRAYLSTNINTNIIDAITKVPGITAVTTGPNVSKPYIRGLGSNRILTLYDGVRQEGQQWGDEHGVEVDQYSIDRVEVVKGPSSLTYGSDAIAGVVNLIPTQPAPEGKIIGEVLTEYQSNNRMLGGSGMLSGTKNGIEWLGRISHKQAINYQNPIDGRVYGTAYNETDATAYLGFHGKWGFSHFSISTFNDKQKIPDGSRDSLTGQFTKQITEDDLYRPVVSNEELNSYDINGTYQHIRHMRLYSNNSFTLGSGRLLINLGYQHSHRQEFSHPEEIAVPGLDLDLHTTNYDLKYYFPDLNGWNIVLGVNGMYQKNDVNKGTEFVIPSYHQFDLGPFFLAKKTFDKIDISGGLRYDSRSFTSSQLYTVLDTATGFEHSTANIAGARLVFPAYTHNFSGISGSAGFTYNATDKISFKANFARGFRAPNVSEIGANGVHPGTNIYQIGRPDFKPEFSNQEDIGFVYASKLVVVNMSVFNNIIRNYIYNQKLVTASGADSVVVPGNQTFQFQQSKASLYGGEINVDFHPLKNLHFENSFSVVFGRNKGNGKNTGDSAKYLPFIPPAHGLSELRYDFTSRKGHFVNGFLKAQMVYYAAQNQVYLIDNTETPTAGYTLFNLGAGAGITGKNKKTIVTISLIANNLFNVAYYNHLSRLKYFTSPYNPDQGIHDIGRNIAVKLDFPLNFSIKDGH